MNGYIFKIIALAFLLIVSAAEAAHVVEVDILAEDSALNCYIPALVLIITLME